MQAVILLVGMLMGTSLLVGVVTGLAVVIWAHESAGALQLISNGYYVLVGLMPIALWLALYVSHDNADYATAYSSSWRAILTTMQGAIIGAILGAGPIFLAVVVNLPVILAGYEISEFGPTVRDVIIWSRLLLAVGAATASALPLGFWVFYITTEQDDN